MGHDHFGMIEIPPLRSRVGGEWKIAYDIWNSTASPPGATDVADSSCPTHA